MRVTRFLMLWLAVAMAAGGCAQQPAMRVQMAAAPTPPGIDNLIYGAAPGYTTANGTARGRGYFPPSGPGYALASAPTPVYQTPAKPLYGTAPTPSYAAPAYQPSARPLYATAPSPTYAAPAARVYAAPAPRAPTYAMAPPPSYAAPAARVYAAPAPRAPTYAMAPAPTYPAPAARVYTAPAAPIYAMAPAPTYAAPAAPTYAMAPAPTYAAPAAPTYAAPAEPTYAMAPAPTYAAPAESTSAMAPAPTYAAPAAPAYGTAAPQLYASAATPDGSGRGVAGGVALNGRVAAAPVSYSGPSAYSYAPNYAPTAQYPYTLDSGDRLRVVVFGQDGLTNSYVLDAGGQIQMPLIGQVAARGLNTDQLSERIGEMLRQGFIREPHVAVEIEAYRPFFILGEVTQPGQYPYVANMTAETAVAIAGGFGPRALRKQIIISRNYGGQALRFEAPVTYPVRPGDTIQVQERWF